ncbi:hypothetical protein K439DRAFT_1615879 [Ramaria rubella]|nr:hypothetical protein K439DRAFT_1615879 [Ramaria rubella]
MTCLPYTPTLLAQWVMDNPDVNALTIAGQQAQQIASISDRPDTRSGVTHPSFIQSEEERHKVYEELLQDIQNHALGLEQLTDATHLSLIASSDSNNHLNLFPGQIVIRTHVPRMFADHVELLGLFREMEEIFHIKVATVAVKTRCQCGYYNKDGTLVLYNLANSTSASTQQCHKAMDGHYSTHIHSHLHPKLDSQTPGPVCGHVLVNGPALMISSLHASISTLADSDEMEEELWQGFGEITPEDVVQIDYATENIWVMGVFQITTKGLTPPSFLFPSADKRTFRQRQYNVIAPHPKQTMCDPRNL